MARLRQNGANPCLRRADFHNGGAAYETAFPNFVIHELHRYALLEPNTQTCKYNYLQERHVRRSGFRHRRELTEKP